MKLFLLLAAVLLTACPEPPTLDVAIEPAEPSPLDELEAVIVTAPDGSPTYAYQWFKDGVEQPGETAATLSADLTEADDLWRVAVTPTVDGTEGESAIAEVTIGPLPSGSDQDGDGHAVGDDCDDEDAAVYPGATEVCNDIDDDCDDEVDEGFDLDSDGFTTCGGDCDDNAIDINPDAEEACNGEDDDCDGSPGADEFDDDGDTFIECAECDDANSDIYPGAPELCDGLDNDCDDVIPADETDDADGDGTPTCFDCDDADDTLSGVDVDGDSFSTCDGDCEDGDPTRHPNAAELCDGTDNDCDGTIDNGFDDDGDGTSECGGDCDDNDAALNVDDADADGSTSCDGDCDDNDDTVEVLDVDGDGQTTCAGDCDDNDDTATSLDVDVDGYDTCDSAALDCDDNDATLNLADLDGDGETTCDGDCDDTEGGVFTGSTAACDGIDDTDCDGQIDSDQVDDDSDGASECDGDCDDTDADLNLLDVDTDGVDTCSDDCDDTSATVFPGSTEACDGVDDTDCDGNIDDDQVDDDGDGLAECDGDCDDADPNIGTGGTEVCNGIDDDCDLSIDEDFDGDSDGDTTCGPDGIAGNSDDDCDDTNDLIGPSATELCDGLDNDCSGSPTPDEVDDDNDGSFNCADCVANDPTVYPGAPDVCDSVLDNDCDGVTDPMQSDDDADGVTECGGDCDDTNIAINPSATEIADGVDEDCNGLVDDNTEVYDDDGDGQTEQDGDCDDASTDVYSGAPDLCDSVLDNNCDSATDAMEADDDSDGDSECEGDCDDADASANLIDIDGDGVTTCATSPDCDDNDATSLPGAPELCDGVDNDCDTQVPVDEVDGDVDGFLACEDCDDSDATSNSAAAEICDGVDNDCDSTVPADEGDDDGDGWIECASFVDAGLGLDGGEDCNDTDNTVYPTATELCDTLDNDCDNVVPADETDDDGDSFTECADGDCDDTDVTIYLGAAELCDGLDNACAGSVPANEADGDADGSMICDGDCDDTEANAYPGNPEVCDDAIDNDCVGGDLDCQDADQDGDGFSPNDGDCDDFDDTFYPGAPDPADGEDQDCDGDPDLPDDFAEETLTGDTLPALSGHAAAWDPVNSRIVVVGGQGFYETHGDVWGLDPSTGEVTDLAPGGDTFEPRRGHSIAVDEAGSRLLAFGGQGFYETFSDVMSLDLTNDTWSEVIPTNTGPAARVGHTVAWDSAGDRLLVFGGQGFHELYGDLWALNFAQSGDATWEELVPTGDLPSARSLFGATWDDGERVLFVGGGEAFHDVPEDFYLWDATDGPGGAWVALTPNMGAFDATVGPAWAWDSVGERVLQVGGHAYYDLLLEPQAIDMSDGAPGDWFGLAPTGPDPVRHAELVFLPDDNAAWLIGGSTYYDLVSTAWTLQF